MVAQVSQHQILFLDFLHVVRDVLQNFNRHFLVGFVAVRAVNRPVCPLADQFLQDETITGIWYHVEVHVLTETVVRHIGSSTGHF